MQSGVADAGALVMQAVTLFRQWWDLAGARVPWADGAQPGMSSKPSRQEMLDRWNSHTKFCPTCQKVRPRFSSQMHSDGAWSTVRFSGQWQRAAVIVLHYICSFQCSWHVHC